MNTITQIHVIALREKKNIIGSVYTTTKSETNPIFFGLQKVDPIQSNQSINLKLDWIGLFGSCSPFIRTKFDPASKKTK